MIFERGYINSDALFDAITKVKNQIMNADKRTLWFRGLENNSHGSNGALIDATSLIPSMLHKGKYKYEDGVTFEQQFYRRLSEYSLKISEYPEAPKPPYNIVDIITHMQHYEAYTNALDFSDNFFSALYFAIEPLILYDSNNGNAEYEKKRENSLSKGVSLFLLDFIKLNEARIKLIENLISDLRHMIPDRNCPYIKMFEESFMLNNNKIHSISDAYERNDPGTRCFIPSDIKLSKCCINCPKSLYDDDGYSKCYRFFYPLAVYANRSNANIIRQNGAFTLTGIHFDTIPYHGRIPEKENIIDQTIKKLSIESMQKDYFNLCNEKGWEYKPFVCRFYFNGEYTVKSLYKLSKNLQMDETSNYMRANLLGAHINMFN